MRGKCGYKILLFCLSIILLSGILSVQAAAEERQEKTIRVGYPIQQGLSMQDEDGNLSGYSYDYLMEMSQYTGWNYEFVLLDGSLNEQLSGLMEMLKKGEIDIMGAMYYDESLTNVYSYPGYYYGINYSGLFVPEESKLRDTSIYNLDNIKVGVHNRKKLKSDVLEQYAQMNNLNVEQVVTDSADELYDMTGDGRADAIMSTDLTMAPLDNMYAIAHFSPKPFYFITTKGNTDIIRRLDYAMSTIEEVNPDFMVQLYNKYFSKSSTEVFFSDEEKLYIENCGILEVAMYDNKPPFQYIDSDTGKAAGITVEILELIGEKTGISFKYHTVSTYTDYVSLLKSGKADIGADALINFQDSRDMNSLLTLPWCELPVTVMFHEDKEFNENGKPAIPYFLKNAVGESENAVYYDSVEECLNAVKNGDADYCYIGDFCSQYYSNKSLYSELKKLSNSGIASQKLCFGIGGAQNTELLMIVNKGISSLPADTINEIIYRNIYQQHPITFSEYLQKNRTLLLISALALSSVIFIISFIVKNRQQRRIAFENRRYNAISNLANEYFYEYNVSEDELLLSEKCADYFGCEYKIPRFSKQLRNRPKGEVTGIWQIGQYIINNEEGSIELSCEMPDFSRHWFKIYSSNIENKKKQIHAVGKITDIQNIKAEQIRLERQASIDNLTGIYNIAAMKELVKDYLKQYDSSVPCAMLILDIDNFKQANDTFGHLRGDAVLIQAAELITSVFSDGLAGRLGGDEFVIFLPDTDRDDVEKRCQTLCSEMVRRTKEMLGVSFSWSIGITWIKKEKSYETLYQEADTALYATKEESKNGFSFYGA